MNKGWHSLFTLGRRAIAGRLNAKAYVGSFLLFPSYRTVCINLQAKTGGEAPAVARRDGGGTIEI